MAAKAGVEGEKVCALQWKCEAYVRGLKAAHIAERRGRIAPEGDSRATQKQKTRKLEVKIKKSKGLSAPRRSCDRFQ